jgi:hypothetical protein
MIGKLSKSLQCIVPSLAASRSCVSSCNVLSMSLSMPVRWIARGCTVSVHGRWVLKSGTFHIAVTIPALHSTSHFSVLLSVNICFSAKPRNSYFICAFFVEPGSILNYSF